MTSYQNVNLDASTLKHSPYCETEPQYPALPFLVSWPGCPRGSWRRTGCWSVVGAAPWEELAQCCLLRAPAAGSLRRRWNARASGFREPLHPRDEDLAALACSNARQPLISKFPSTQPNLKLASSFKTKVKCDEEPRRGMQDGRWSPTG